MKIFLAYLLGMDYYLMLLMIIDHEDQICQLREKHIENSHECSDKDEDCAKIDIVADCEIPIADNIDILSTISNVQMLTSVMKVIMKILVKIYH